MDPALLGFLGEANVESTMIDAVSERWHVTTAEFQSYDDLYKAIRPISGGWRSRKISVGETVGRRVSTGI